MIAADPIAVCVVGAVGRMGRRLVRLVHEQLDLRLVSALDSAHSDLLGHDVGELAGVGHLDVDVGADASSAIAGVQVVIDFSAPSACAQVAPMCAERGIAYVVGSTGLTAPQHELLEGVAGSAPVLVAANFSVGVNVLLELTQIAAARLGSGFDVEIGEIHHRAKRDAPSGTALALGGAVQAGRGALRPVRGRQGTGVRRDDELGYAALRGGDVTGEHTVYFFGEGERLELTHRAASPDIFAVGALRAARWLVSQGPGLYSMTDVLAAGG